MPDEQNDQYKPEQPVSPDDQSVPPTSEPTVTPDPWRPVAPEEPVSPAEESVVSSSEPPMPTPTEQLPQPSWDQTPPVSIAPEVETPPQPLPTFTPSTTPVLPPKPKRKRGLIVAIIVAAIIVLLAAGTALAYKFWYQNPEKVVTDAFVHAIEAKSVLYKGNLHITSDTASETVTVKGQQGNAGGTLDATMTISMEGQNYTLDGSALIDKSGDLYVKVAHLDNLANDFKQMYTDPQERAAVAPLIDQLKAKIDGTWIKISSSDLKDFSDSYATTKTCLSDAVKKFQNDKAARTQLTDLYEKHQFITIEKELGAKNGSLGYDLSSDDNAAKAFATGLKSTDIYKQLHDCDSSFTINSDDLTDNSNTKDNGTVTVWVSRWTHEFTKLTANGKSDGTTTDISIEPTFNQPVTVTTPAKSTTLHQLESDISQLIQAAYMSAFSSSQDATTAA